MLSDLYREIILDHNKNPRNRGELSEPTHGAEGYNPLCGDHFWVELILKDGSVQQANFHGQGCALSTASASMMTTALKGLSENDAEELCKNIVLALTGNGSLPEDLEALSGVQAFPMRVKCVTLPWHTARAAMHKSKKTVHTEE